MPADGTQTGEFRHLSLFGGPAAPGTLIPAPGQVRPRFRMARLSGFAGECQEDIHRRRGLTRISVHKNTSETQYLARYDPGAAPSPAVRSRCGADPWRAGKRPRPGAIEGAPGPRALLAGWPFLGRRGGGSW